MYKMQYNSGFNILLGQIGSESAVLHGECRKWQMVALVVSRKLHTCMSSSNGKKEKVKLLLGKCYGECFSLSLSLCAPLVFY
jgi:hypothetical protein